MTRSAEAQNLVDRGYCRVSNKHKLLARIDREDWKERLAAHLGRSVAELHIIGNNPNTNLPVLSDTVAGIWCDYYRRTLSKDIVEVGSSIFGQIPSSDHNSTGYLP